MKSLLFVWALLGGGAGDDEFQGVLQSHCRQAPNTMLPIAEHWKGVSVTLPRAEVCVSAVLGITQVGQRQREHLLHLQHK